MEFGPPENTSIQCRFNRSHITVQSLLRAALIFIWGATVPAVTVADPHCEHIAIERLIVDSILNQNQQSFDESMAKFDLTTAVIPSSDFYIQLKVWHQGYQNQDDRLKRKGIKAIRRAISRLEQKYISGSSLKGQIALGIAKGHAARILIESKQYLSGYDLGIEAKQHLEYVVKNATETVSGYHDAGFLLGMYEIYTSEINQQSHWLISSINYKGNRQRGIRLVEAAITNNAVFATEALRALLGEVSWRTPEFCGYVDTIDQTGNRFRRNSDLAVLRQGLLLKCGFTYRAQKANQDYMSEPQLPEPMKQQITKAQFRIAADLGNIDALNRGNVNNALAPYHQLARANALDVIGLRSDAIEEYKQLTNASGISKQIQNVSKIRISHPYSRPTKINTPQKALLQPLQCS